MGFLFGFTLILFLLITFLLCSVILVQESKGMGMGASFGGDVKDSMFGTSTAGILKKVTGYLAAAFMIFCVMLSLWTSSVARKRSLVVPQALTEETEQVQQ